MSEQIVYKVVVIDRITGQLFSSFIGHRFHYDYVSVLKKEYAVDKVTKPYPGTKLFAFKNLEQAVDYAKMRGKHSALSLIYNVYEAAATGVHKNGWLDFSYEPKRVVAFFKKGKMEKPIKKYNSSVVCDTIKLIERVWTSEDSTV